MVFKLPYYRNGVNPGVEACQMSDGHSLSKEIGMICNGFTVDKLSEIQALIFFTTKRQHRGKWFYQ
jgi:hypothetical protein